MTFIKITTRDINNNLQEEFTVEQVSDVHINNASFPYNYDYNTHSCITDTYYNKHPSSSGGSNPIVNAAGLTIIYTRRSSGQVCS